MSDADDLEKTGHGHGDLSLAERGARDFAAIVGQMLEERDGRMDQRLDEIQRAIRDVADELLRERQERATELDRWRGLESRVSELEAWKKASGG